ncbi:hypothetical protein OUZ56_016304 [Daphnia magna]|uniref:Transmembrane protein n=1 Tax=Daphnia magna TaxID=35525 RepID=A0ABR0AQ86_9CRUS|nr:hypothetical protein OUZ56_016304 [Daphnia magna]
MNNPRSLVIECPKQRDSRDSSRTEQPLVGILEILYGCSIQTDEWISQASRRHSLSSARKGNDFLPHLKATVMSRKPTNLSLQALLEASLRRIGSSFVSAANDWEREKRASRHHTYPFELWGMGAAFFMSSVAVFSIQWCRGRRGDANIADLREHLRTVEEFIEEEAKKRRARRWSTMMPH